MSWSKGFESKAEFQDTAKRQSLRAELSDAAQQEQFDKAVKAAEGLLEASGFAEASVWVNGHTVTSGVGNSIGIGISEQA